MLQHKAWPDRFIRRGCSASRLVCLRGQTLTPRCSILHPPSRALQGDPRSPLVAFQPARIRPYTSSVLSAIGDTIYALSTAPGRAGIAVIRISGSSCRDVYNALCPAKALPRPRFAAVRSLYDPLDNESVLDSEAVVLYFPGPKTVTGEDVLELHVHGGPATVKAVLSAIPRCPVGDQTATSRRRIRYAEPGEFTKRAFVNERLDLAQVESLSDTLTADTEQQRRAAVRGNSGTLGRTYDGWREQLLQARGEIEALIDFSEDQHFDEPQSELLANVTAQIDDMLHSIRQHEQGSQRSELLRNGIRIALVGPPNVGKSSLMNLIVGREASIVSGEAGTTRDIVEASLDIRGFLCSFADTAGFRSQINYYRRGANTGPIGAVEKEGIRRARQKALESDIVVVMTSIERDEKGPFIYCDEETLEIAAQAQGCMVVVNKADEVNPLILQGLLQEFQERKLDLPELAEAKLIHVSCREAQTGQLEKGPDPGNVQAAVNSLVDSFSRMTSMPVDMQDLLGVTERQRQLLVKCRAHLEDFMAEAQPRIDEIRDADTVLAAEHLRYAADCLARITGKGESGDVEDVLGVVFEKFCVGK